MNLKTRDQLIEQAVSYIASIVTFERSTFPLDYEGTVYNPVFQKSDKEMDEFLADLRSQGLNDYNIGDLYKKGLERGFISYCRINNIAMDASKLSTETRECLHRYGLSDLDIQNRTARQLFEAFCEEHGIIGYANLLFTAVRDFSNIKGI